MTATVHPISPDPKRAQAIADSHGLLLLADGRMVREYRVDADSVINEVAEWVREMVRVDPKGAA